MNIAQWLWATSRSSPDSPALLTGERVEGDYQAFAAKAAAITLELHKNGVGRDDRVAIFMQNSVNYLYLLYGIWWAGAAAVPINHKLHAKEVANILENCGAEIVFCDQPIDCNLDCTEEIVGSEFVSAARTRNDSMPEPRLGHELAWLFYTSGTTGDPKGVMLSHDNLQQMSLCYLADVDSVHQEDGALYVAPMSHGAGLYNLIHVRRGTRHIVPASSRFDANEILDLAKVAGPVSFFAAPTMVRRLVDAAADRGESGQGIRTIVYGGGPMYLADIERAIDVMGQRFVQIYGQGESPMTISCLSREAHSIGTTEDRTDLLGSVGRAHSVVEIRITDDNGETVPTNVAGEIEVRGSTVMSGYWKNPEATRNALKDGWLRTGDIGSLDSDGYLTLLDRSKDLIISGGSNIHPREVEELLLTHPLVSEVAVVGETDEEWGEVVVACVVPIEGAELDTKELDRHCLESMARFKRPKRYVRLDSLPKNAYGKVLRRELREQLAKEQHEQK